MNPATPFPGEATESKSSLLTKLPADLRLLLHQALIDRDPPTYRAVFAKFKLADHGASFTAFYYYARRIRHQADLLDLAQFALPEDADVPSAIHNLISHRLLESLLHDDPSPRTLHRLSESYRIATATLLNLQRQKEFLKDAVRKERQHDTESFREATAAFRQVLGQHLANLEAQAPAAGDQDHPCGTGLPTGHTDADLENPRPSSHEIQSHP